jgi:catechol 2,3-dioxygenase-like lactoylglutathione lyase family enzyme
VLQGGCPTVPVADFDQAIKFYSETLGLKLLVRFGNQWACLDAGDGLLIGLVPRRQDESGPSVGLYVTEPIEGAVEKLGRKGVAFNGPPVADGPVRLAFSPTRTGMPST